MATSDLNYFRPKVLKEACDLGRTFGAEGRFLAGGTELLVDFRRRRESAKYLISLQMVPDLKEITVRDNLLCIGAMATMTQIAASPQIREVFPALGQAASMMGNRQVRNRATIGGNFSRAVPCADTPPICIAAHGRLRLIGAERERILPAEEFFVGPRLTTLMPGELLVEIQIPVPAPATGASYQRFTLRRGSALAVASVAAAVTLAGDVVSDARVVLGSVAPVPLPATRCAGELVQKRVSAGLLAAAGKLAAAEAQPITDIRGSIEYRRKLVDVLTVRALEEAVARAGGEVK